MSQNIAIPSYRDTLGHNEARWIRIADIVIISLALPCLAPIFMVLGLAVKLTSVGPIFYKAKRIGQAGKLFYLYKFRTMYVDADRRGPAITLHNDPRVTPVGRFLRRTKLDELPQLINVLGGEMSLVGPRPEAPDYVAHYTASQRQLLALRPGLTSPASLRYSNEQELLVGDDWESIYLKRILPHKLALDATYLHDYSLRNYLALLFATLVKLTGMPNIVTLLTKNVRNRHVFQIDLLLLALAPFVALALREDAWSWSAILHPATLLYAGLALVTKTVLFYQFGLYRRYWQYTSLDDLGNITTTVMFSTLSLFSIVVATHPFLEPMDWAIYRTIPLIDGLLTGLAATGVRLGLRALDEWQRTYYALGGYCRVMIIGADGMGTRALREIKSNPNLDMAVVAFIDDDPAKIGTKLQGVPVLGPTKQFTQYVQYYEITQIIITASPFSKTYYQQIEAECRASGVQTAYVPDIHEWLTGQKTRSPEAPIDFNQLLNRQPVVTDKAQIAHLVAGSTVMITGAGGSIGSELCRQLAQLNPARLVLLGHGENSIFEIGMELRAAFPDLSIQQIIADVRDTKRINQVVSQFRPQIIYHAAAHKHVPLMQASVEEAITNNVLGTRNVLQAAEQYGVPYFVLISTDKAINPTSMMGASKRMAELLVKMAAQRSGYAYKAVRFGNVLGSRGSVIPIFQRQIAAGGPLTITHPEMTRYFMTIPEAVQLVLQATVLGQSGEIFVLDMGQPVRILDLAKGLIQRFGKAGAIDIIYSGIRPGEKLHEELFQTTEHSQRTNHEKIFVATEAKISDPLALENAIAEAIGSAQQLQTAEVIEQVKQITGATLAEPTLPTTQVRNEPLTWPGRSRPPELRPVPVGSS